MKNEDTPEERRSTASEEKARPGDARSDQERTREALEESEARYRALFEQSREGIVLITPEGTVADANQAFADVVGRTREEIRRMDMATFFAIPEDRPAFDAAMRDQGFVKDFEWKVLSKDGLEKDCLVTSSIYHCEDGRVCGYQSIVHDVTEQKKNQENLLAASRLRALGEMAAAAAHNFRNLLQIMVGGTRLALCNLESGNVGEVRSNLEQVLVTLRSAGETARLLNHFAAVRRDRTIPAGRTFDLSRAVEKAVEICVPWLEADPEKEGLEISLSTSLQPDCLVKGVEAELVEVAINLILNAAEASPAGGDITVSTVTDGDVVILRVQDTGIGIPKENLPKIFQPFFTTKGLEGAGLGLASSYGIVCRHGGDISVESKEGQGSAFIVELPLPDAPSDHAIAAARWTFDTGLRLLVVDDLEPLLRILKHGLTKRGHKVSTALSGDQALELFQEHEFDAVICDLAMPHMSGWQVGLKITDICRQRGIARPPFILLTGWGEEVAREEKIADSGVDAVVEKPMDILKLLEVVRELVQEREGRISPP
jgi:two-component system, cell cycle sensor histidine kinase and response regulator CckA